MRTESAEPEKRQKVYSAVKKRSDTRQKATETVQRREKTVGYAPKNGRKFTAA